MGETQGLHLEHSHDQEVLTVGDYYKTKGMLSSLLHRAGDPESRGITRRNRYIRN